MPSLHLPSVAPFSGGCAGSGIVLVAELLIGIARVYVGVHWPADVRVGAPIGLTAGTLTASLLQPWHFGGLPRGNGSFLSGKH